MVSSLVSGFTPFCCSLSSQGCSVKFSSFFLSCLELTGVLCEVLYLSSSSFELTGVLCEVLLSFFCLLLNSQGCSVKFFFLFTHWGAQ